MPTPRDATGLQTVEQIQQAKVIAVRVAVARLATMAEDVQTELAALFTELGGGAADPHLRLPAILLHEHLGTIKLTADTMGYVADAMCTTADEALKDSAPYEPSGGMS